MILFTDLLSLHRADFLFSYETLNSCENLYNFMSGMDEIKQNLILSKSFVD